MSSPTLAELPQVSPPTLPRPDGTSWPRISIVTPSYNQAAFLEETMMSVLSQGYPNLEYLVLDGGSTDGSIELIKKYQHLITYWRSGPDDGPYATVHEGFQRATGDLLAWLNSDDTYFPGCLSFVAGAFAAFPDMHWLSSSSPGLINRFGDRTHGQLTGISRGSFAAGNHLPGAARRSIGHIQQESTFFRKALYEAAGGLRRDFKLAADFALWADFFYLHDVHVAPVLLAGFRSHGNNRSRDVDTYSREGMEALSPDYARRPSPCGVA